MCAIRRVATTAVKRAMADADEKEALAARVRGLAAVNERLRIERAATRPSACHRWRSIVSAVLIAVATLLPLSTVTVWARVQLIDEEPFVEMMAPLVDDPAVRVMIVDETMLAIQAQV